MIAIKKPDIQTYHPDMSSDPLKVEKGWCHFSRQGTKDFLDYIEAFQPEADGVSFAVRTFRGVNAQVKIAFVSPTAFRFRMFPRMETPHLINQVFDFPSVPVLSVEEEALFITTKTDRLTLRFRKCPWEMTVELDGEVLTKEQIKDHNVDQPPGAVFPVDRFRYSVALENWVS